MPRADGSDPQAQKQALIEALNEHRINTLGELRRVERIFAQLGSADLTQPMTAACTTASRSLEPSDITLTIVRGLLRQLEQPSDRATRPYPQLPIQVPNAPMGPHSLDFTLPLTLCEQQLRSAR